jgi:hypothetical protein
MVPSAEDEDLVIDANFVAVIALLGVIVSSFAISGSKNPENTTITLVVAALLFMPVGAAIKIPLLMALNRDTLPYLCFFLALLLRRGMPRNVRFGRGLDLMLVVSMIAGMITWRTNTDPVTVGKFPPIHLQGLTFQDGLANVRTDLFLMAIPFVLGRMVMRGPEQATHLIRTLAVGALVYTLPILVELRMSPQVHNWIYGRPASTGFFGQSMRGFGYRPNVFLPHGIAVGLYMSVGLMAAVTLVKLKGKKAFNVSWKAWSIYLLIILIACKSVAAMVYGVICAPLIRWGKPRKQIRIAAALGILFLAYPAARSWGLFPVDTILSVAASYEQDRADSLKTRFDSEDAFLEKVSTRPWFGWGGYGRANLFNDYGQGTAIFDGFWIILLTHRGAIHMAAICFVLAWPLIGLARRWRSIRDPDDRVVVGGLALMLASTIVDLIPNGLFCNYPFFIAGALVQLTRILPNRTSEPREPALAREPQTQPMMPPPGPETIVPHV